MYTGWSKFSNFPITGIHPYHLEIRISFAPYPLYIFTGGKAVYIMIKSMRDDTSIPRLQYFMATECNSKVTFPLHRSPVRDLATQYAYYRQLWCIFF